MNNNPSNSCYRDIGICLFHPLAGLSLQNRSGSQCAVADLGGHSASARACSGHGRPWSVVRFSRGRPPENRFGWYHARRVDSGQAVYGGTHAWISRWPFTALAHAVGLGWCRICSRSRVTTVSLRAQEHPFFITTSADGSVHIVIKQIHTGIVSR